MNEVKSPKKPLVYYYAIVILVILALNFLAVPWLSQRQVKEVDYGTFMTMTENQGSAVWRCKIIRSSSRTKTTRRSTRPA